MMASDVAAKRLELLKEAVPSRILVLSYLAYPIAPLQVKALEKAAHSMGVTLQVQDIRTADDLKVAFDAGARAHAEGLLIFVAQRAQVSELAARYRLPLPASRGEARHSQGGRSFGSAGSGCTIILSDPGSLRTLELNTLYRSDMTNVVLQLLFVQRNHRL
jgi:hypothetical protein